MHHSTLAYNYENKAFNRYSDRIDRINALNEQVEQTYQELFNDELFTLIEKLSQTFELDSEKLASLSISKQELSNCEDAIVRMLEDPDVEVILEKILRAEASSIVNN